MTVERVERLVELEILAPADTEETFRSGEIGDGVELYFRRPSDPVVCALELCDQSPQIEIPGASVGINAGPLGYENADFYGLTVNIAARIASHAHSGEVLVSHPVASHADDDGVRFDHVGLVAFKGVAEDIVVYRALRA